MNILGLILWKKKAEIEGEENHQIVSSTSDPFFALFEGVMIEIFSFYFFLFLPKPICKLVSDQNSFKFENYLT